MSSFYFEPYFPMDKVKNNQQHFERYFMVLSYLVAVCGLAALYISGAVGIVDSVLFLAIATLAWFLEKTKWHLSDRIGVVLLVLIIPLFVLDWRFHIIGITGGGAMAAGGLARLILLLCAVKLLQNKTDRDWIFIYMISFFEILLAAGLSISPLFLVTLLVYLLLSVSVFVAFEIRKTSRQVAVQNSGLAPTKSADTIIPLRSHAPVGRLSLIGFGLLAFITFFAVPLFFVLPRVGGAGLGSNSTGGTNISGFSDSVRLGEIGRLKLSDKTVMRVKLKQSGDRQLTNIYWRGVALDQFDGQGWSKSKRARIDKVVKGTGGFFALNIANRTADEIVQTVYLEPLGTPILFLLSRPISVRGNFNFLTKGVDGSLKTSDTGFERTSYVVRSDPSVPGVNRLRADTGIYSSRSNSHLQLPRNLDTRISNLAFSIVNRVRAANNYDKAKAIEMFLRSEYGYSLEMKAGGKDPLADFLFNVREGHCEYYSTAMTVMLRTQGIAARVVNGFQEGEFNETADAYVVKQRDAHSWVEVYFPDTKSWITFDPTPTAGQFSAETSTSIAGRFNKYLEALETFWIQYFVSYDSQEQRSLFESAQSSFVKYKDSTSGWFEGVRKQLVEWWKEVRGDKGLGTSISAIALGVAYVIATLIGLLLLLWLYRRITRMEIWQGIRTWLKRKNETTIVEFYQTMQKILASKGFKRNQHQTPLEFAYELNIPEAVKITEKYHRVRFGEKDLSKEESEEIEDWLRELEIADEKKRTT